MQALHRFALAVGLFSLPLAVAHARPPQSPINFQDTVHNGPLGAIGFTYPNAIAGLVAHNEGSNNREKDLRIQFPAAFTQKVTVGGVDYDLQNLHFHAHAEHQRNGVYNDMELHLVHNTAADGSGANLAIGIWLKVVGTGDQNANATLADIFSNIPVSGGNHNMANFNLGNLLPASQKSWRYKGSLTTPHAGSNTDVDWIMLDEPIMISQNQVNAFTAKWNNNGNWRGINLLDENPTTGHRLTTDVPEPGCEMLMLIGALVATRAQELEYATKAQRYEGNHEEKCRMMSSE